MNAFGLEIKRLRNEAGLTQKQLAEKIGVSQPTVAQLESGRIPGGTVETLYALSDALGVPCDHWRPFLAAKPAEGSADVRTPKRKKK